MSDAPEGPDATRGSMQAGDPGLEGATETGGTNTMNRPTGGPDDNTFSELPAEKDGNAGAGTG